MARPDCPKCGGTGWKIIEGDRELSPAVARVPELAARQAAAAGAGVISIDSRSGRSRWPAARSRPLRLRRSRTHHTRTQPRPHSRPL